MRVEIKRGPGGRTVLRSRCWRCAAPDVLGNADMWQEGAGRLDCSDPLVVAPQLPIGGRSALPLGNVTLVAALMLLVPISRLWAASSWAWQNPMPRGNHLYGVSALNASTMIAVGDVSTVITTSDGGATWTVQINAPLFTTS
jgi:hypothetical protein